MTKIICVGDIHIKLDNTHLIDSIEEQLTTFINKYDVDYVILLGDILHYHEKLHTQSLNKACKFIENLSQLTKVICIVGNHDYIQNGEFCSTNHWLNPLKKWKNVFVIDKPTMFEDSWICIPYVPPGRFIEALNLHLDEKWKQSDIIFAHQEFKGCKMGAIISEVGDEWDLNNPLVISGHIHDRQQPQPNINYIGSCLQHSFSETGYPILLLVNNVNDLKELSLVLPRKKSVYVNLEEMKNELDSSDFDNLQDKNIEFLRIVVKGDYDKFKVFQQSKKYEELQKNKNIKIVFKPILEEERVVENIHETFEDLLYKNVLRTRDEKLYTIYQNIIYDVDINFDDILIV